ncbi:hypothetical protein DER46DRAFT_218362 [Fusarium sp. MPI-SDFR-AT-0072]|nr:hypothetical protein DER46DRAFT_218362 [Fusarium sp. MPI-SDFR-AT-0072]
MPRSPPCATTANHKPPPHKSLTCFGQVSCLPWPTSSAHETLFRPQRDPTIWCHLKADICRHLSLQSLYISLFSVNATSPYSCGQTICLANHLGILAYCHVVRSVGQADRDMGLAYSRSDSYNPSVGPQDWHSLVNMLLIKMLAVAASQLTLKISTLSSNLFETL